MMKAYPKIRGLMLGKLNPRGTATCYNRHLAAVFQTAQKFERFLDNGCVRAEGCVKNLVKPNAAQSRCHFSCDCVPAGIPNDSPSDTRIEGAVCATTYLSRS